MSKIYAYVTCTRVNWDCDDESCNHFGCMGYPSEEHGWIDVHWNPRILNDSRSDVRAFVNEDDDSEDLENEVRSALNWLEGGWEDNGDGTFYAVDSYRPFVETWGYSYALHFTEGHCGVDGWIEKPWHPKHDGGIDI